MAAVGLLAFTLIAARVSGDLGARAEASASSGQTLDANGAGSLSVTAGVSCACDGSELNLTYGAQGRAQADQGNSLLHTAGAGARFHLDRSDTLSLQQGGSLGRRDFSLVAQLASGQTAPPIDRLPAVSVVSLFSSSSSVAWTHAFSRSWSTAASAGFTIGGGLGSEGRAALPLQKSGLLGLSTSVVLSRHDRFNIGAAATVGRSSTGQQTFLSNLSARWARTLSRRTSFEVGVGLAVIDNPPVEAATGAVPAAPAPAVFLLTPTVSASLSHAEQLGGSPIRFTLAGSVEPAVDPLTGSGYLRSSGTATVTWTPARMVTVAGSASGAKAVSTTLPHEWAARTDLSASFLGPRLTRFVIGGRWSWLPFVWAGAAPGSALPSLTGGAQWGAYCAVDFLAHSAL